MIKKFVYLPVFIMSNLSEHDKAILNCVFNPNLPLSNEENKEIGQIEDIEDDTQEVRDTKCMEIEAVDLAEKGELENAVKLLSEAIAIAPKRASLYNNRAHVYQFQRKFEEAFADLTTAIELASSDMKKTLRQAHCQRGVLHRRANRLDEAREDFEVAAKFGSQFAKSQLVELNPYAALCNQMLRQVMDNLK